MGMAAQIFAIGPFRADLVRFYEYPEKFYANTAPGAPIVTRLFELYEGSNASRVFASHLGMSDAMDFNQHKIAIDRVDFVGLRNFLQTLQGWYDNDYPRYLEALEAFAAANYDLYFIPNA